jgi:hypothetical protein
MAADRATRDPVTRHRLFFLATAFAMRGMNPEDAYRSALYYVDGPGRGQNWIAALAEHDSPQFPWRDAIRPNSGVDQEHTASSPPGEQTPG